MKKITILFIFLFLLLICFLFLDGNIGYFKKSTTNNLYWMNKFGISSFCKCFGIKINNGCIGISFDRVPVD